MPKVETSQISRNTLFFFLLTFLGLTLYIFSAFLMPGLVALIFVVTMYPWYQKLSKALFGNKAAAAFIINLLLLVVLLLILVGTTWLILGEVFNLKDEAYEQVIFQVQNWFNPEEWNKFIVDNTTRIRDFAQKIPFINDETVTNITQNSLQRISELIAGISTTMVVLLRSGLGKIGSFFINLFYFYLASFYFFLDGDRLLGRLFLLMPIKNRYIDEVKNRFSNLFKSWVIGNIAIMLVQGTLGGIGFAIAGVPSAAIWGVIMIFTGLIPFIGTTIIWAPASILLLASGHYASGIFLLIWGVVVVGLSDNIVRPFLLRGGAHLSLFILFFAFLGGLSAFGVKGLLLGPIIVVFLDTVLHIYSLEYEGVLKELNR